MRDKWKSRKGFIFASIGAAVGLGNLWRFPFQAYKNGGGAFFLPYIIAILTCAIPLMIMEYAYGRKIKGGSIKAFSYLNKKFEIIGWIQVIVPIVVMMFYCIIISISFIFMIFSLIHAFGIYQWMDNPGKIMDMATGNAQNAFDFSSGISIYLLVSVLIIWFINWAIVKKGVSNGIEKISNIFTPMLLVLIIIFMFNSLRLEGSVIGLNELFTPDFKSLLNPNIWVSAYAQVFFSTTLAVGVMIAYGSYLDEKTDIINNAFITVLANSSFDIISGITVFSTLGYLVNKSGIQFDSFGSGAGIAFIAFPTAISTMTNFPFIQGVIGFLFFTCLFIAGISSSISMFESFETAAMDKFNISRQKLTSILSIIGFIGSMLFATRAGFNFILDIVDMHVSNYVIATLGLVEVIIISYFYGTEKLRDEANRYSDFKIGKYWDYLLKYFTPILLGITVITNLITGIKDIINMDSLSRYSTLLFGWGTILVMIISSYILLKHKWKKDIKR